MENKNNISSPLQVETFPENKRCNNLYDRFNKLGLIEYKV